MAELCRPTVRGPSAPRGCTAMQPRKLRWRPAHLQSARAPSACDAGCCAGKRSLRPSRARPHSSLPLHAPPSAPQPVLASVLPFLPTNASLAVSDVYGLADVRAMDCGVAAAKRAGRGGDGCMERWMQAGDSP